jgi:hypothetical protein
MLLLTCSYNCKYWISEKSNFSNISLMIGFQIYQLLFILLAYEKRDKNEKNELMRQANPAKRLSLRTAMSTWCLFARMLKFLAARSENFLRFFLKKYFKIRNFSRARKFYTDNIWISSMKIGTIIFNIHPKLSRIVCSRKIYFLRRHHQDIGT